MTLDELIEDLPVTKVAGTVVRNVTDLAQDSRLVKKGGLFFAVTGTKSDGHNYIADAIKNGAETIVCERLPENSHTDQVTYVLVESTNHAVGPIASAFYGHPSFDLQLVGITGTNGKTTVATLLYELFTLMGYKVGLVSTVEHRIGSDIVLKGSDIPTNPDALELHRLFKEMIDEGCTHCFMEATSHGIHQGRVHGVDFTGVVFTNITHDHIDYHHTFQNYLKAKQSIFDTLSGGAFALANLDDQNGEFMLQNTNASKYFYSMQKKSDFDVDIIDNSLKGLAVRVNKSDPERTQLIGSYNAYNLAAVFGAAYLLDETSEDIMKHFPKLTPPAGRFEIIRGHDDRVGIVDYAHTPDAVENILQTINDISFDDKMIITVIGAGGDRDTEKRPIMARLAYQFSTYVILTSDNPRTEEPLAIIEDMKKGIVPADPDKVFVIPDRQDAIKEAVDLSEPGSIIVVLGKGHEPYQEIHGHKYPFDDRKELRKAFKRSEKPLFFF